MLLIAISITVLYGWVALFGVVNAIDIVKVWMGINKLKTTIYLYEYKMAFQGLCGTLGIIGLWLSAIFYVRLSTSLSALNKAVVLLLTCGIIGAVYVFVDVFTISLAYKEEMSSVFYVFGPLLLVSCLSGFLIFRFMMPNKRLQGDAATPRT